jgi:hypothetical protein
MSKSCTICSSSQVLQDRVATLAHDKVSYKKTAQIISHEFNLSISASSIGRHLHSCLSASTERSLLDTTSLERLMQNPTDRDTLHEALCVTLSQAALQCHEQIVKRGDLESFKALEVLVNVQDKLYPHAKTLEQDPASSREETYRTFLAHGKVSQVPQD